MRIKFPSDILGRKQSIDKDSDQQPAQSTNQRNSNLSNISARSHAHHDPKKSLDSLSIATSGLHSMNIFIPQLSSSSSIAENPVARTSNSHVKSSSEVPSSIFTVDFLDSSSFAQGGYLEVMLEDEFNDSPSSLNTPSSITHEMYTSPSTRFEDDNASESYNKHTNLNMIDNWNASHSTQKKKLVTLDNKNSKVQANILDESLLSMNASASGVTEKVKEIELVSSIGKILVPHENLLIYEKFCPSDLLIELQLTSNTRLLDISDKDERVVFWQSPPPSAIFDKTQSGKLTVKKGTLFSLVSLLISQESVADPDYLNDILTTYRYFSNPIDVCRILVLRYMEIHHAFVSQSNYAGKSQDEANAFTQMRILNAFKKWSSEFIDDFLDCKGLKQLVTHFMNTYVKSDSKRSIFAVNILERIAEKEECLLSKGVEEQTLGSSMSSPYCLDTRISTSELVKSELNATNILHTSYKSSASLATGRPSMFTSPVSIKSEDGSDGKSIQESSSFIKFMRSGSIDFLRKSPTSPKRTASFLPKKRPTVPIPTESTERRSSRVSCTSTSSSPGMYSCSSIADFDPDDIVMQLTLLEQQQFVGIPISEFFNQKYENTIINCIHQILDGIQKRQKNYWRQI